MKPRQALAGSEYLTGSDTACWCTQMDTRAQGFACGLLSEIDLTVWEAKLWLSEGTLAQDLVQYNGFHGWAQRCLAQC